MKFLICHLSDIHLVDNSDKISSRVEQICAAIGSIWNEYTFLLFAVTGDIAQSGKAKEYIVAREFFQAIRERITKTKKDIRVEFFFVPGNHDCDFSLESDARPTLLQSIEKSIGNIAPNGETAKQCLAVQKPFFKFAASFGTANDFFEDNQLIYEQIFKASEKVVRVIGINTAWLSQKHEKQGELFVPLHLLQNLPNQGSDSDFTLIMFHHPYYWIQANNCIEFRGLVEQMGDLILTGHEHTEGLRQVEKKDGESFQILEGDVLQNRNSTQSGFNLLLIDLNEEKQKFIQFAWKETKYSLRAENDWRPLVRNTLQTRNKFSLHKEFYRELDYSWNEFSKFANRAFTQEALFVYPDLKVLDVDSSEINQHINKRVRGSEIIERLLAEKYWLITGDERTGKTALARKIFLDLYFSHEKVPVLIAGGKFKDVQEELFNQSVKEAFLSQYDCMDFEAFRQLEIEQRVLIIDDFHSSKTLNGKARFELISFAQRVFGTIIVFGNDVTQIEEFTLEGNKRGLGKSLYQYSIRRFGKGQRAQLIKKWILFGKEASLSTIDYLQDEQRLERLVNVTLGKSILPAYPFFILTILQNSEIANPAKLEKGSYGGIYEALIIKSLSVVIQDDTDFDKFSSFISRLAYFFFDQEVDEITEEQFFEICRAQYASTKVRINDQKMLDELIQARILYRRGQALRFSNKSFFFYFVASYFHESINNDSQIANNLVDRLDMMTKSLDREKYANTLIFFLYLKKDIRLIKSLLNQADCIFSEHTPSDLENDVSFFNERNFTSIKKVLPSEDTSRNREIRRQIQDEYSDDIDNDTEDAELQNENAGDLTKERKFIKELNQAFKTLELLGQIIRNFPYSFEAKIKEEIVLSCFVIGLKCIKAFHSIIETEWDLIKEVYSEDFVQKHPKADKRKISQKVEARLNHIATIVAEGVINKISHSVGHEKLSEIYKDITSERIQTAIDIVKLSIQLNYQQGIPTKIIKDLKAKLENNPLVSEVLAKMVVEFMTYQYLPHSERQKLSALFKIDPSNKLLLAEKNSGRR